MPRPKFQLRSSSPVEILAAIAKPPPNPVFIGRAKLVDIPSRVENDSTEPTMSSESSSAASFTPTPSGSGSMVETAAPSNVTEDETFQVQLQDLAALPIDAPELWPAARNLIAEARRLVEAYKEVRHAFSSSYSSSRNKFPVELGIAQFRYMLICLFGRSRECASSMSN